MFSSYDPATTFSFPPSEAANLEYSILSTILGSAPDAASPTPSHQRSNTYAAQPSAAALVNGAWPGEPTYRNAPSSSNGYSASTPTTYAEPSLAAIQPADPAMAASSTSGAANGFASPSTSYQQGPSQYAAPRSAPSPAQAPDSQSQYQDYSAPSRPAQPSPTSLPQYNNNGQTAQQPPQPLEQQLSPQSSAVALMQRQPAPAPTRSSSATLLDRTQSSGTASWAGPPPSELEAFEGPSVYKSVTKPYDYTEGYHFLMKHLPVRCVLVPRGGSWRPCACR